MAVDLYSVTVDTYKQIVSSSIGVMQKALDQLGQDKCNELLSYKLAEDMLPMAFQIHSIKHHSLNALKGMEAGEFGPPPKMPKADFSEQIVILEEALATISAMSRDDVNGLASGNIVFKLGEMEVPFTNENFAGSFSVPNLMFHASTLYDMLRINGVKIGKMDFLGQMRVGH